MNNQPLQTVARPRAMTRPQTLQQETVTRPRAVSSDFSIELMPSDKIVKRELHPWTVHHSVSTSNWIATICRPVDNSPNSKTRHAQFVFPSERDARKFCHAYAPPKLADKISCQGKKFDVLDWLVCWDSAWIRFLTPRSFGKAVSNRVTFETVATVESIRAIPVPPNGVCA